VCQSHLAQEEEKDLSITLAMKTGGDILINPLGEWTGGINTDSGATNRKLGSDMGDGVTGGGLHGKDLSKADVSVNIWCFLEAERRKETVEVCCSIGDEAINGIPYSVIVKQARDYIQSLGGFEKFAEWGLIRPINK
jgi:S-adenosylmethionine synthetase